MVLISIAETHVWQNYSMNIFSNLTFFLEVGLISANLHSRMEIFLGTSLSHILNIRVYSKIWKNINVGSDIASKIYECETEWVCVFHCCLLFSYGLYHCRIWRWISNRFLVMLVIEVARYRLSPNVAYTVHVSAKVKSGIERKRERERERERERTWN